VIVSATGAYLPNSIQCHPELVSGSNSSGNEMPKRVRHDIGNGQIHICYCHTPPRYLYGFATARNWEKSIILGSIGKIANHFLRLIDFKSAQNVDYFIANSKNVAGRIKKFYRRDSTVIYPPVELKNQELGIKNQGKKDYYLAGGRLARPKNIDLIVKTFVKLGLPLKVFGRSFAGNNSLFPSTLSSGPKGMIHNSTIEFVGEVSDEEKLELMKNAKAFVFAAEDEDFGITPVEAMSVGTPVIAYLSGGVVESIIDGKTGIFYRFNDLNHLSEAVSKFEKMKFDKETIMKYAQKFSKERFKKEIKKFVESKLR
jgi:glycosyltransferase involved in cell wall biosynthesis